MRQVGPLSLPLHRHAFPQRRQRHLLRVPTAKDRLHDLRREQRQPQQA